MRQLRSSIIGLALAFGFAGQAHAEPAASKALDLAKLPWSPLHEDGRVVPLALNDQGKPAAVLARIPGGQVLKPHAGNDGQMRIITVVSGTLFYADGSTVDPARETAYPAGSVLIVPPEAMHWAAARQGDVAFQVVVVAPSRLAPPIKAELR